MRMKTYIKLHPPKFCWDWVYLRRMGCWKPVKAWRTITKGRKSGDVEVTLYYPEGRKYIVPVNQLRKGMEGVLNFSMCNDSPDMKIEKSKSARKRKCRRRKKY